MTPTMMRAPTRVRYNGPEGTSTPPKTSRKRQSLIGNDKHSRASATALERITSIFLIGNEFRLQDASFGAVSRKGESGVEPACRLPAVAGMQAAALQSGTPGCAGRGRSPSYVRVNKQRPYEGTKSRFLVAWLLGMTIAGVEIDEGNAEASRQFAQNRREGRRLRLVQPEDEHVVEGGAEEAGGGDGEDPGPDDAAREAPADGCEALRCSDAGDGSGDDVRGAHGNSGGGGTEQSERGGGLRGESGEGLQLGDALAHGAHHAPASGHCASGHGESAANDHPVGDNVLRHVAAGDQSSGDDAHAFLRVICAVAEAERGGGKQLQAPEPAIDAAGRLAIYKPTGDDGDKKSYEQANHGRDENENHRKRPAVPQDGFESRRGDGRAAVSAHQRVRRATGNSELNGGVIPDNRAHQSGEQHLLIDEVQVDEAFAHGRGHCGAEGERRDEIPECRPYYRPRGPKHSRRNNRRDGAGGVVPAIGEVKHQADDNDDGQQVEGVHALRSSA